MSRRPGPPEYTKQVEYAEGGEYKRLFLLWQKIVGAEKIDELPSTPEQARKILYESLTPAIDKTLTVLGFGPEADLSKLAKKITTTSPSKKEQLLKTALAPIILHSKQINFAKWAFYPKEMIGRKAANCSGTALLLGRILNRSGITAYYGNTAEHSCNFIPLSDCTFLSVDDSFVHGGIGNLRSNIIRIKPTSISKSGEVSLIKFKHPDSDYRIAVMGRQSDGVEDILGNCRALKDAARRGDSEAQSIVVAHQPILDSIDFKKIDENLFPDRAAFFNSGDYKDEIARLDKLHRDI